METINKMNEMIVLISNFFNWNVVKLKIFVETD
jgi:hypothetical protein